MKKNLIYLFIISIVTMSCDKWNDYMGDFDYTAVYFSYQNQLRTIVADDDMSFEFGVYMGGRRENKSDEWATFEIDPELLNDTRIVGKNKFKLLPEEYYTLSDPDRFVIPKGSFLGTSVLTLNKDKFTADPDALKKVYALPVKIVDTSVDSILAGSFYPEGGVIVEPKDYAVIVIKYINEYHGNWYLKGTRYKKDAAGEYQEDNVYSNKDLSRDKVVALSTVDAFTTLIPAAGGIDSEKKKKRDLEVTVGADGAVQLKKADASAEILTFNAESAAYNPETRTFEFKYEFSTSEGEFRVEEQLIWRNTDLKFEQW